MEDLIDEKLLKSAYCTRNFDSIPPIIGIITADQYGNTIMVFEHDYVDGKDLGPITSYLSDNDEKFTEIDLISMYFSSIKIFAGQNNIQDLSHLEIHGSNIKVQIYFLNEKYMFIVFLNSNAILNAKEKSEMINYLKTIIANHEREFDNFNSASARKVLSRVENLGRIWLKRFNKKYLQAFNKTYLEKSMVIEKIITAINPIISSELAEYLEYLPEDHVNDLSKELRNKIQDKLCSLLD